MSVRVKSYFSVYSGPGQLRFSEELSLKTKKCGVIRHITSKQCVTAQNKTLVFSNDCYRDKEILCYNSVSRHITLWDECVQVESNKKLHVVSCNDTLEQSQWVFAGNGTLELEGSQICWMRDNSNVLTLGDCNQQFDFQAIRSSGNL